MNMDRRRFILISSGLAAVATVGNIGRASAQDANSLFVVGDTVEGGKNRPASEAAIRDCVLNNIFPRNSQIVWRMRVVDPKTGQPMDDTMLKSVEVHLGDGTVVALKYGGHPPQKNLDFFWSGPWLVPKDYPTGTLQYSVLATANDGRTGEFKPFNIPSSLLTITDEVLQDVAAEGEPATDTTPGASDSDTDTDAAASPTP